MKPDLDIGEQKYLTPTLYRIEEVPSGTLSANNPNASYALIIFSITDGKAFINCHKKNELSLARLQSYFRLRVGTSAIARMVFTKASG